MFTGGDLQLLDVVLGIAQWKKRIESTHTYAAVANAQDKLLLLEWDAKATEVHLKEISGSNGQVLAQSSISGLEPLDGEFLVRGEEVVLPANNGQTLCTLSSLGGGGAGNCQAVASISLELSEAGPFKLHPNAAGFHTTSKQPGKTGVAFLKSVGGHLTLIRWLPEAFLASQEVEVDGSPTVALLLTKAGGLTLQLASSHSGSILSDQLLAPRRAPNSLGDAGVPAVAILGAFKRNATTADGIRLLLGWEDARLELVQGSKSLWVREEALAQVEHDLFVDLPAAQGQRPGDGSGAKGGLNPAGLVDKLRAMLSGEALLDFVKYQILGVKVQLQFASAAEVSELKALRDRMSGKNTLTRDANGFRKIILVLTRVGKVFALHSGDGRVLWARAYPRARAPQLLRSWRTFHDITHAPQVLLLHTGGPDAFASVLDGHTGEELSNTPLPDDVQRVVPIHRHAHEGRAEQSVFLLLRAPLSPGGPPQAALLPDDATTRPLVRERAAAVNFWLQDPPAEDGAWLRGYGFTAQGVPESGPLEPVQTWATRFTDPVLAIATRDPTEPVYSAIKVLGDRSLKYKYLNPNTAAVFTGLLPSARIAEGGVAPRVVAHVLDTVTGAVLHRLTHIGARGPVAAVFSENWVVYQYLSLGARRYEVGVMELYDATPRNFSALEVLTGGGGGAADLSSYAPAALEVLQQAYFTSLPARALAITRTALGITSKMVLLATISDQVYQLDKRLVNPRRPLRPSGKPTPQDMEEGLFPYADTLPLFSTHFATVDKQVDGLRRVSTEPTALESTCHMMATGVDLFYTRLLPAKAFDSLDDDFAYGLLVLALSALAVASVVVQRLTANTVLANKWK